jgi:nucleoside phosphorylase
MATHVYAYHGGTSEDDGLKARPRVWEVAHGISQLASHLGRTRDWTDSVPSGTRAPKVHFGAIGAGEVVQNSRISYEAKWIREHYNDALAIEMEAAGVARAGHLNGSPVAIVRGISDRADGTKTTSGAREPQAAANAAAFAVRLGEELIKERRHRRCTKATSEERRRRQQIRLRSGRHPGCARHRKHRLDGCCASGFDRGASVAELRSVTT